MTILVIAIIVRVTIILTLTILTAALLVTRAQMRKHGSIYTRKRFIAHLKREFEKGLKLLEAEPPPKEPITLEAYFDAEGPPCPAGSRGAQGLRPWPRRPARAPWMPAPNSRR